MTSHEETNIERMKADFMPPVHKGMTPRETIGELQAQIDSLKTALRAEQAMREAAETAQIASERAQGYWYRRATVAEETLVPFSRFAQLRDVLQERSHAGKVYDTSTWTLHLQWEGGVVQLGGLTFADFMAADVVLAESRKGDPINLETFFRDRRQEQAYQLALRLWGDTGVILEQRAFRFVEESLELYQAVLERTLAGKEDVDREAELQISAIKLQRLLKHVFSRPPGEVRQEIGGVMFTLLCLAQALSESVCAAEKDEVARLMSKTPEEMQARWAEKVEAGL